MNAKVTIPTLNNGNIEIQLENGKALFMLGANGVGKSSLVFDFFRQNPNNTKRISAYRVNSFNSNAVNITATAKRNNEANFMRSAMKIESRHYDGSSHTKPSMTIYNLVNSENVRAREITKNVDEGRMDKVIQLKNKQSSLNAINELLSISNIPIELSFGNGDSLLASKNGSPKFSIAELSDGERNAFLICADVLTAKPNQLIIIDEPERHLHRSIISPLLSSLFEKRKDCTFIVSTHDISLPIDQPDSSVLLVRDCTWQGKNIVNWDADLISDVEIIPDDIKENILGTKRKILFVEGNRTRSLDFQIYPLLFPDFSVVPCETCIDVERAVSGIRNTTGIHWIEAYGMIDLDNRIESEVTKLKDKGIAALKCYSVESIYYHPFIIKKVAETIATTADENADNLYLKAIEKIKADLELHKDRLCALLCEKQIRVKAMSNLPNTNDIISNQTFEFEEIDVEAIKTAETEKFETLSNADDLEGLILRYPIRTTSLRRNVSDGLGIRIERYENIVRNLVDKNAEVKEFLLSELLVGLKEIMDVEVVTVAPPPQ